MKTDNQKWESINKKSIFVKKPWFEVFREEIKLPDGKLVPDYYEIAMPHYSAVFAITTDQKIIVLRCYRHAIGEVTLTMPGGMIEEGESPLVGIKREFLEETGYKAKEWESLGTFVGNSTRGCGTYHFFLATGAEILQDPNSGDLEELEILLWSREDVEYAIDNKEVQSLGVMSMLLLGLRCIK